MKAAIIVLMALDAFASQRVSPPRYDLDLLSDSFISAFLLTCSTLLLLHKVGDYASRLRSNVWVARKRRVPLQGQNNSNFTYSRVRA